VSELLDLRTLNATWHDGPCAEVRVGEHVTRYVRRGSGQSVVLVGADVEANALWAALIESLASGYRMILPQCPPRDVDASIWLRGFIEGIGLTSCVLIAGGPATAAAVDLATSDSFTVRKLVVIGNGNAGPSLNGCRALWVPPNWSPADSTRRIEEFIHQTD
jgi:hypothetical protein